MTRIMRMLGVRKNETSRLALASSIFFLVAVNDGIVKSVSSGVFNIRVGVDHLPEMYTWIAWLFSLTMVLLSYLTTKISRQRLLFNLLVLLGVVLAFNAAVLWLEQSGAVDLKGTGFYPFLFISSEMVRSMANFQVWIVAGGICYTSRAKILFPLLAASTTIGDITGGFLVQVLGAFMIAYQIYGLSVVNMAAIIALLRPLVKRYFVVSTADSDDEGATMSENIRFFAKSTYLKLLFVLSIAIFALYTSIHYGFNVLARMQYETEGEITSFFGLFFGLAGLATLLTTTLLSRLLRWLGAGNVYLWVCAVYLLSAALLMAVFGDVLPIPEIAVIFALNLLSYVLLDSIVAPTYQVMIKLVPQRNSDGTRMIMEGGFMLLGGLLGAGVTALHAQNVLTMGQFFLALAVLSGVMVLAGWHLKKSYTDVLIKAVRDQEFAVDPEQTMQAMREVVAKSPEFPRSLLLHRDDGVRSMGIEILRQSPDAATAVCEPLITHENARIRSAAVDALSANENNGSVVEKTLQLFSDDESEVRLSAARFVARSIESYGSDDDTRQPVPNGDLKSRIIESVSSRLVPDADNPLLQVELLYILEQLSDQSTSDIRERVIQDLLGSDSIDEITAGIGVACRLGKSSVYPEIINHLEHAHPAVREAAINGLSTANHDGVLESFLAILGDPDPDVVQSAVTALANVHATENRALMVAALNEKPVKEWEGLLAALSSNEDDGLIPELSKSCQERLVVANRFLVAIPVLREALPQQAADLLIDQLQVQLVLVQNGVIRLLGQMGDVDVVTDLVERLSQEDPGARENAIELLENIGDSSMMELLIPLLIDDLDEQCEAAGQVTGWSVATIEDALSLTLSSPDTWTQMAAVWATAALERTELFDNLPEDLEPAVRETIAQTTARNEGVAMTDQPLTTMEKIAFLKESSFFAALPLEELYHISLTVQEETVKEGTTVIKQGTLGDKMYIVAKGEFEVRVFEEGDETGQQVAVMGEKMVFGDMTLLDDEPRSASVIALQESNLLSLQRGDLERILRRYSSIAFSMMKLLSKRLREANAA